MPRYTREDIVRVFGPISDHTIVEVLNTSAELEDLELAALRLAQEDDAVSAARKTLEGAAAQIFDIVRRDALYAEEIERERSNVS